MLRRVLAARGLDSGPEAAAFLEPRLAQLHDPSALTGIDRAAERILSALDNGETIAIYGDYDVDGVTATAILQSTLERLRQGAGSGRVVTYIPHRIEEGYGLNVEAIEQLAASGTKVVVTVDCGVSAVAPAARAKQLGLDLIITDHHNPPASISDLPEAFAVVHPRHPPLGAEAPYPFGDLCGAGVAYKLAWRLCTMRHGAGAAEEGRGRRLPTDLRTLLIDLLALVALGVIADVVPLVGENRVLARYGLERIKHSPIVGLRALVEASGLADEKVRSSDVGFRLAPRLNAAGRMGHANDALELFTTLDPQRAREIAEFLTRQNNLRREVERRITEQAVEMAESAGMTAPDCRAIVLAHEDWHAGVVGIACSRLVNQYNRPTILMQRCEGECHGSGRSIDGFNLHAGLETCAAHLDSFGGHDMAAGLHLREVKLADFVRDFTSVANSLISDEMLRPMLDFDADARLDDLSLEQVRALDSLAPFGRGNPEPRVRLGGVRLTESPRPMGTNGRHVSLSLTTREGAGSNRRMLRVVAWDWRSVLDRAGDPLRGGTPVEVVVKPTISTWTGAPKVEAELCDLRIVAL